MLPLLVTVLLNCNTPIGPDAQITVIKSEQGLTLKELTTNGKEVSRSMSQEEFDSGFITLRQEEDSDVVTTMSNTADGWWMHAKGEFREDYAYADCF